MYHRNIVGVNAAKYTKDSPLVVKTSSDSPVTFSSSVASFSARLSAGRTYYLNARFLGGEWGVETEDGRKAELSVYLNGRTEATGPGAFKASVGGDAYIRIKCTGEGEYSFCDFSVVESPAAVDYAPNPDAVDVGDGEIKIYRPKGRHSDGTGSTLGIFPLLDSSVRKKELMGTDTVTLQWDDTCEDWESPLAIPLGSYVVVDGTTFRCLTQYQPTQSSELVWHYEVEFHSPVSALSAKPFFFYMEDLCETDFSINGVFKEFTDALATAIQRSTGEAWTIVAPDNLGSRALSFSESTIFDAIGDIAEEFDVEWLASGTTLTFVKDATSADTRTLSVGDDIAAPSASGGTDEYFNRYYAFGSTRNIVRTDYNTLNASVTSLSEPRLKLPTAGWTDDDGTSYAGCPGGYVDYDDGALADDGERNACVKVYDDIYPQSDLSVSSVSVTKKKDENGEQYPVYTLKLTSKSSGGVFTIKKSTYNKDSNPDGMLISGLNVSVNFTSGLLQGRELELSVSADGKELTIVPDTSDSIMIPNDIVLPKVGDTCIVFNIRMPDSYRVQAERRLQKKLLEDIAKAHAEGAQLTLTSYPSAGVTDIDVGDKLVIRNGANEQTTRCVSFEQCIDIPSSWTITTGETAKTSKVRTLTEDVGKMGGEAAKASKSAAKANREAWKSSQELLDQVFDPDGEFFTERVKPLVVETANLTVGTKSQQFVIDNLLFGFDNGEAEGVSAYFYAKAIDSAITPSLQHYAIDPDGVRTWRLNKSYTLSYGSSDKSTTTAFTFSADAKGCYIYAVCQKFDGVDASTELNGHVMLSDRQITAETPDDTDNYYFLLGMLSSEITTDGVISRSVTLTFGQTTVNGRYVRTGRIESVDGKTYFDLDAGEIGGNIKFSTDNASAKDVIDSLISSNDTVKGASSAASAANAAANAAKTTANAAKTTANEAKTTAAEAKTAASAARRNYIRGTRQPTLGAGTWETATFRTSSSGGTVTAVTLSDIISEAGTCPCDTVSGGFRIVQTDTTKQIGFCQDKFSGLQEGGAVTLSLYAWASCEMRVYTECVWWSALGNTAGEVKKIAAKTWTRVTQTFTLSNPASSFSIGYAYAYAQNFTTDDTPTLLVCGMKLEKGSEASVWSEAPEDTDERFSLAMETDPDNLFSDQFLKKVDLTSSHEAPRGNSRQCTYRDNYFGEPIPLTPGQSLTLELTARRHPDDTTNLAWKLSMWWTSTEVKPWDGYDDRYPSDLGPVSMDGVWRRYSITLTVPAGATSGKVYVQLEKSDTAAATGGILVSDVVVKLTRTDYLRQSLQEATEAQTSITGGLILSKLIGVKSSAGVVVSGINGTDSAVGNGTPMLWAGATSKDTWNNAAFRVYNSGHVDMGDVSITSAGADGRLTLSEGDIMLSKSSGATTSLTSKVMGSLASALGKAGGDSVDYTAKVAGASTTTAGNKSVSGRKGESYTVGTFTAGATETITLFTAPYTGKCTITTTASGTSTLATSYKGITVIQEDGNFVVSGNEAQGYINQTWSNSKKVTITAVYKNGTKISGTTSFDIVNGAVYTATVSYSNTYTLSASTDFPGSSSSVTFATVIRVEGGVTAGGSLAMHLVSTEYVNKYYADGYMLFQNTGGTDSTLRYAGMTSADATVMQMRSGSSLLKFTADGLLQSLNGGSTFYRANPLICSFKLWYKEATETGYTCEMCYNPKGWTNPKAKRESAGLVTITHNFGIGNCVPQATFCYQNKVPYLRTIIFDSIGSNSLRVHIGTGNTHYDPQDASNQAYVHIFLYDFTKY